MGLARCRCAVLTGALLALASGCVASEEGDVVAASPAELHDELARARPGDVVSVGGGRFVGSFVVPAGVTLRGAGAGATTIQGDGAGPAITLQTGTGVTSVSDLAITSPAHAGILVAGSGEASIAAVKIDVEVGVGVEGQHVGRVTLRDATIRGPVTEATAGLILAPEPETHATHGLVFLCAVDVLIERTSVRGFASAGALFVATRARWLTGDASENRAIGLAVHGGTTELADFQVIGVFTTAGPFAPQAIALADGATLTARRVRIERAGFGIDQTESDATYSELDVRNNTFVGLRLAERSSASIDMAQFADNGLAAIAALAPEALTVRRSTLDRTQLRTVVADEVGVRELGDGLLIVQPAPTSLVLEDIATSHNHRIGVLVDLGGASMTGATIARITVAGEGDALGFVVQNGTVDAGWDATVTRLGATAANDPMALVGADGLPRLLDILDAHVPTEPRPAPFAFCSR